MKKSTKRAPPQYQPVEMEMEIEVQIEDLEVDMTHHAPVTKPIISSASPPCL